MGAGDLLDSIRLKVDEFVWGAKGKIAALVVQKRTKKEKSRILLGITGMGAVVLVAVVITIVLSMADRPLEPETRYNGAVPDEEFFLPDEPDFLPPVILFRERKDRWTDGDAAPYWTDPAAFGGDWDEKVENYVDTLLEGIP
jgi:hypothetical protein